MRWHGNFISFVRRAVGLMSARQASPIGMVVRFGLGGIASVAIVGLYSEKLGVALLAVAWGYYGGELFFRSLGRGN
jgi:hypothetical protein